MLNPRYGTDPVLTVSGEVGEALVRQRQRLHDWLAGLDDGAWAEPSRCEGWSVRDVVVHLVDVNRFWTASIRGGRAGAPTELLRGFDPAASPPRLVAAHGDRSPGEVLALFAQTNVNLARSFEGLDDPGWEATAESPLGHVSTTVLAHHALWDGWVHERDVHAPLVEEPDELAACVRFVAGLGPAFALCAGQREPDRVITATDLGLTWVVTVTDHVDVRLGVGAADLTGPAVEVIERLSLRRPLDPAQAWLVAGLATTFR